MKLYYTIGKEYNLTRKADSFISDKLFRFLDNARQTNIRFLDVGCGTGNYTTKLSSMGLNFCGIDPSKKMLQIARTKSKEIEWKLGSAELIPYCNLTFEGIIAILTIHHWKNLK